MNLRPLSLEELQVRLLTLEKQNHRFRQLGLVGLIGATLLLTLGQVPSKKTIEANEFILRDDSGNIRARLSMGVPAGAAVPSWIVLCDATSWWFVDAPIEAEADCQ